MVKIRKMSAWITYCVSSCCTISLKLHRISLLSHTAADNCNFPSRTRYCGSFSAKFTTIPGVKPNSLRAVLEVIILITELLVYHINH